MKLKLLSGIGFLVILIVFSSYSSTSKAVVEGDKEKNELLIKLIMQGLNRNHFTSPRIDDNFSEKVYDLYMKRLDYNKRFLVQEDIRQLEAWKHKLDDEINAANYEFFELSTNIIEDRIEEAQLYYQDILNRPFDFTKEEDWEMDPEKMDFVKDKTELKERWRKSLKYATLQRMVEMIEEQEEAKENGDEDVEIKPIAVLEEEARKKVLKNQDNWFRRLSQLEVSDRVSAYVNSVVNAFDPHTGFFPPKDKEDFDIAMSGRLEGIGATLTEKDGYIKVERIVPGSASWKQGDLEAGDLILKVGQADEEPVDVVDMRLDKAVKMIRGPKGTEVRLTVKKVEGDIMTIPIIRDIVILDETYARSVMLQSNKGKKKVGLIYLPKFYADFNGTGGRNCADDVKQELTKLMDEGAEGVILDLRNNGGGSLNHVVRMAGLFIEKGPIVQVKGRSGAPQVMKDQDPTIHYDGPVIVLVNSFSASASEILAAALQDYDRAIIMGSSATFGKGTVQRFYDLDRFVSSEADDIKPLGAMKLTTQKFYRIDGGATQLKGVIPDVVLPDNYSFIDVGEKERDYSLVWDEISPVPFEEWNQYNTRLEQVIDRSKARVDKDGVFKKINENAARLKRMRDETEVPLNLEAFNERKAKRKEEAEAYKDIKEDYEDLKITSLKIDMPAIESDSSKMARIEEWHKNLQKDPYVYEALNVMRELR